MTQEVKKNSANALVQLEKKRPPNSELNEPIRLLSL